MKIEMELVTLSGGQVLYAHARSACAEDESCSFHKPSKHHMLAFPQRWREDRFMVERICPHGVGHPDPDQIKYWDRVLGTERMRVEAYHGCDGCCSQSATTRIQGTSEEEDDNE